MSTGTPNLGRTRTAETYRPSGKVPAGGIVVAAAILIPFAVILGVVYSFGVVYIPFVKLRGVLTFFYGGILGGAVGVVCHMAKFRSRLAVLGAVFFVSLISYYTSWAVHAAVYALKSGETFADCMVIALNGFLPQNIYAWATLIHDNGLWAIGKNGGGLKGIGVCILWLVEALTIFGTAFVARVTYGDAPFCEDCNRWTEETKGLANLPVAASDPAWQDFAAGDLDAVKRLQIAHQQASYVELQLAVCETCSESDFVSAVGVVLSQNNDGELQKNETPIVKYLRISREQRNEIEGFAVAMAEAVATMSEEMDDEDDIKPAMESTPEDPV